MSIGSWSQRKFMASRSSLEMAIPMGPLRSLVSSVGTTRIQSSGNGHPAASYSVARTYFIADLIAKQKMVSITFVASPDWSAAILILGRFPPPENGTTEDSAAPS